MNREELRAAFAHQDVGDKGFVKIVDILGDDGSVVQAARVTTGKGRSEHAWRETRASAQRQALIQDVAGFVGSDDAEYANAAAERLVDRALLAGCRAGLPPGALVLSRAQAGLLKGILGGFLGGMASAIGEKGRQDYLALRRNCENLLLGDEETAEFMRLLGDG